MTKPAKLLSPWYYIDDVSDSFSKELQKEVAPGHELYGVKISAVARRYDCDDFLFELHEHACKLAFVHLTFHGVPETDPDGLMQSFMLIGRIG